MTGTDIEIVIPLPVDKSLQLCITISEQSISSIRYQQAQSTYQPQSALNAKHSELTKKINYEIECYFNDAQFQFSPYCELHRGTDFQQRVWRALIAIPAGEVRTYGSLAEEINTSARAVGNACRQNLFPLIVPCHRVVSAAGIGGYAGDTMDKQHSQINFLHIKQWLLAHEKADFR